jgi:acyl-CoA thioesterase-1
LASLQPGLGVQLTGQTEITLKVRPADEVAGDTRRSPSNTMAQKKVLRRSALVIAAAAAAVLVAGQKPAAAQSPACVIPDEEARFELPLARAARQIAAGLPVTIVAIGSSSTYGAGATSEHDSYPSQLAAYLAAELPRQKFAVHNRGVNGDTASGMLARFGKDVIAAKPDLVLWQAGTNSLLADHPLAPHFSLLEAGLAQLKSAGLDVILIDPQYAPRVIAKPLARELIALMAKAARAKSINVFHRFAIMKHWREVEGIQFETFLSPDELHMNDWSYACIARALGGAIAEAATRPVATAGAVRPKR